jgi:predicted O-methyltransferase YrrM
MRSLENTNLQSYVESLVPEEGIFKKSARENAISLGLGRISLSSAEGQLIKTLIALHGCRKFIEIGTLTGLSALYIFEALPAGGELWTIEKDPTHAQLAAQSFEKLDQTNKKIHLVVGDARAELTKLSESGPFDGIFIDGNKAAYFEYLLWSEKSLRPGGLIIADNIFLSGAVWGESTKQKFSEKQIRTMIDFNQRISDPAKYTSAIVPSPEGLFVAVKN